MSRSSLEYSIHDLSSAQAFKLHYLTRGRKSHEIPTSQFLNNHQKTSLLKMPKLLEVKNYPQKISYNCRLSLPPLLPKLIQNGLQNVREY